MLCLVPESKPVTSVLQNGMYTRVGTLALCVLGILCLFAVTVFAQAPNMNAVPVFQAETAKDAQQDGRMDSIDGRITEMAIYRAETRDNHDRIVRDEGICYGIFMAIGILQAAGLITKFKTRSSFTS